MPCVLKLLVDEIRNLPKLNKGSGGADPFVVIEIQDSNGAVVVGGARELNCVSCKTKILKRVLEGYVLETFEFNIDTHIIRSGGKVKLTVMDFKPLPESPRAIGFMELSLVSIANSDGKLPMEGHPLLASGDVVNTFGKKIESGQELRGYRDSQAPSLLHVNFEISTPPYVFVEGVPLEEQVNAWQFHMMAPEDQDEYDERLQERKKRIVEDELAAVEAERKRVARERREKKLRELNKMLREPKTARTNWKEFQDLIGNELMRREWGHGMDKYQGSGGWRRMAGTQVQEDRDYDHERRLIQQWLRYVATDREEEEEVRDFATHFNTKRLQAMTDHLREWSDFGGRYTAELNPGQRSLGASLSRIMSTAKTFPLKRGMDSAFDAGSAEDEEEGVFKSEFTWVQGRVSAEQIAFLAKANEEEEEAAKKKDAFVGFSEFKQALMHCLLQGDSRNIWRPDVEYSLQHFLGELEVVETFEGIWLDNERKEEWLQLLSELRGQTPTESAKDKDTASHKPMRQKTPMVSRINATELVKSLEEVVTELRSMTPPQDPEEYQRWRSECSGREKELDEAQRYLEREEKLAAKPKSPPKSSDRPQLLQIPPSSALASGGIWPLSRPAQPDPFSLPAATRSRDTEQQDGSVSVSLGAAVSNALGQRSAPDNGGLVQALSAAAEQSPHLVLEGGESPSSRLSTTPSRLSRGASISNLKRSKSVRFPPLSSKPGTPQTPASAGAGTTSESGSFGEMVSARYLDSGDQDSDSKQPPEPRPQTSGSRLPAVRLKTEGTLLRKRSRSHTPTAAMSSQGLRYLEEAPDAAESTFWELEHCNGRHYLFPKHATAALCSALLQRPTTQQVSRGVSASDLTREGVFQSSTLDSVQARTRLLQTAHKFHPYVPPASTRWTHTEKLQGGRVCQELDLLPSLHSMSRGGRLEFAQTTLNPRPDTSASMTSLPDQLFHGHIEIAPDRPGGPSVSLDARFAKFGVRKPFQSQLVNATPPTSADGSLAGKTQVVGHIALFDVTMKPLCLFNDLGVQCARKAQEAGAVAAIFIQGDEELISPQGGDSGILIPVLCVRRSDGLRLYNWIDPPRQFNPPYLRVDPWKPDWFADKPHQNGTSLHGISERDEGEDERDEQGQDTQSISQRMVTFWKKVFTEDETGKEWISDVDSMVSDHLKVPNLQALCQTDQNGSDSKPQDEAFEPSPDPNTEQDDKGNESEFRADTGTLLKMSVTKNDVVEMKSGLACIISSSTNVMPLGNGESRDIPGHDDNIDALQRLLPTLGFKVLPPMCNKNADDVRGFLRQVRKGFEKGGALSVHDSLLLVILGHSDGRSVECSMDSSGQIGSLGIQALMEFFSDLNAPGLKGKLKLFLLGLCLGHPVKEVKNLNHENKNQRNVLNSVETGGQASVVECTGSKRATLKVKDEWRQDRDAALRDEGGLLFTNHVSLSFRQVPYSGTLWSRPNPLSTGILVIDLGLFVEGMDTFSVFQLPTIDAKCTSMNVRYCADRGAEKPPSNNSDWVEVRDEAGVSEFSLFELDTGIGNPAGSVMRASRVFRVLPFSSRWVRVEVTNAGTYGCFDGIGIRQLKLFCSPKGFQVPAHTVGEPTWVENPAEPALGPALNRVGADSVWPQYVMPVYAFAGKPRALDSAIGLSADYTLLCYSVPVDGVSDVKQGSMLVRAFTKLLATAHHKHTLQNLLSVQMQSLMDIWCEAEGAPGYREQVRLLQRRCDEDDFPIMLSLGDTHPVSYGIRGPETTEQDAMGTLRYRIYDQDVPEPRNADRNQCVFERVRQQVSMPQKQYPASFHPRLHSPYFKLSHRNLVAAKTMVSDRGVTALGMQLSPGVKRIRWDVRVGGLEVMGRTALSVPHLRVGVVRERVIRNLELDNYTIGEDDDSWAIQTGTLTVYRCHGTGQSPERIIGARFLNGDVVTVLLDLTNKTLAFTMNDSDMVAPFTNVNSLVVPAVSTGSDTQVKLTIENCRTW